MVGQMRRTMAMALLLLPIPAAAQDPAVGGTLAEHWCMGCHVVERVPPTAAPSGVPSFVAIAEKPSTTAASLALYLSSAHTHMPDFSLSRSERDALVAYILSLR
jgi:mono/diheme cytochrome c family protein